MMRKKIYDVMNKIYGIVMSVSFFAGILPLIPFLFAIAVGGPTGEAICVFLYKQFYPWVIALASIAIVIGLAAMYIGGKEGFSVKKIDAEQEEKKDAEPAAEK